MLKRGLSKWKGLAALLTSGEATALSSSSSSSWQDAAQRQNSTGAHSCSHLQKHKHPIRSKPECGGSRCSAPVLLRGCACVWEYSQLNESAEGEGKEGVIKLKRLGEDEPLRIYENRHWLYNPNPVHSASRSGLGGSSRRMEKWGESLRLD